MKQSSFSTAEQAVLQKTCQQLTLAKIDKVVPWTELVKLVNLQTASPGFFK